MGVSRVSRLQALAGAADHAATSPRGVASDFAPLFAPLFDILHLALPTEREP